MDNCLTRSFRLITAIASPHVYRSRSTELKVFGTISQTAKSETGHGQSVPLPDRVHCFDLAIFRIDDDHFLILLVVVHVCKGRKFTDPFTQKMVHQRVGSWK